jgi:hypothetical protein
VYLGPFDSAGSRQEYARIVAAAGSGTGVAVGVQASGGSATVAEILLAFLRHAEKHYRRADGTITNEYTEFKIVIVVRPGEPLPDRTPR